MYRIVTVTRNQRLRFHCCQIRIVGKRILNGLSSWNSCATVVLNILLACFYWGTCSLGENSSVTKPSSRMHDSSWHSETSVPELELQWVFLSRCNVDQMSFSRPGFRVIRGLEINELIRFWNQNKSRPTLLFVHMLCVVFPQKWGCMSSRETQNGKCILWAQWDLPSLTEASQHSF